MAPYTFAAAAEAQAHFTARAANYDKGNGGWHVQLGLDFVEWLSPIKPGCTALDLACGTGLVTVPLAEAIGSGGKAIGVDITKAMLDEARSKSVPQGAASIEWVEHDITDLDSVAELQGVIREQGGFDVISCCSAIVLLPSALDAVAHWVKLLKPGGRMIIDVPTEDRTLQCLFTVDLAQRLGLPSRFDRSWIENAHSLEKLFEAAGLKVEKGWKTRSYVQETVYDDGEAEKVWEGQVVKYADFVKVNEERREDARRAFLELWRQNLDEKGRFVDGHWLYVVVGRKA